MQIISWDSTPNPVTLAHQPADLVICCEQANVAFILYFLFCVLFGYGRMVACVGKIERTKHQYQCDAVEFWSIHDLFVCGRSKNCRSRINFGLSVGGMRLNTKIVEAPEK